MYYIQFQNSVKEDIVVDIGILCIPFYKMILFLTFENTFIIPLENLPIMYGRLVGTNLKLFCLYEHAICNIYQSVKHQ